MKFTIENSQASRSSTVQNALDFTVAAAALKHYIPGDFNLSTVDDMDFSLSNSRSDARR